MEHHPVDKLQLASFFCGDCDSILKEKIEKHLQSCKDCSKYLDSLQMEKESFLTDHPFEQQTDITNVKPFRRKQVKPLYALAASVILFIGISIAFRSINPTSINRIKGNTEIRLFVEDSIGEVTQRENDIYHPHDKVQFVYTCDDRNAFILVSIDEKGKISTYYPQTGDSSYVLEKGADIPLPNSIILDDYIGKELYIAIFSKNKLEVSTVRRKLIRSFRQNSELSKLSLSVPSHALVKKIIISKQEKIQ